MKNAFAILFSAAILLASVPAFACGGDKSAKNEGDDTVVTAEHDADACGEANCTHDHTKKKEAKKKESKEDGEV